MESRGSLTFIRFLVLQQVRSEEFERDRAVERLGFVDHVRRWRAVHIGGSVQPVEIVARRGAMQCGCPCRGAVETEACAATLSPVNRAGTSARASVARQV